MNGPGNARPEETGHRQTESLLSNDTLVQPSPQAGNTTAATSSAWLPENYFIKNEKPVFPVKAKNIMEKFDLKEGRELGQKLKYLEDLWVNNSFNISDKEIEKTFQG